MNGNENGEAGWRLLAPADLPFVYDLVTRVDPRWWRFSRRGLEPMNVLETAQTAAAGVIVFDDEGRSVACAILADTGAARTGMFEYFAVPDPSAEAIARRFAPELIAAAFAGAPIRRLYYERFENDADVLGEAAAWFENEVTFPEFVMIDGQYETRTTSVLTAEAFHARRVESAT